jgi:hypothetical protein
VEQYQRPSASARAKTSDRCQSSQEEAKVFAKQVVSQASVTPNTTQAKKFTQKDRQQDRR